MRTQIVVCFSITGETDLQVITKYMLVIGEVKKKSSATANGGTVKLINGIVDDSLV